MLEFWKDATDINKAFGALLTDLSKAVDCLCHDFLNAKLHAYELDISPLNLLRIIYQIVTKELKQIPFLVPGKIFYLDLHKALSWVLFCSIFL